MHSVTCDTKMGSCARHNLECHTNGLLTVTYRVSFKVYTRFSVFWRHTSSTIVKLCCVAAQNCCRSYAIQKKRETKKQYLAFFLSSSPSTFYSQLEIEVECPLVRLQIYNLNILCLVLCYLNISLHQISNALSLFISLFLLNIMDT